MRENASKHDLHSIDAEQSVLGGLILSNDKWDDIAPLLSVDSFFVHAHKLIYAAAQSLFDKNRPVDLITLSETLEQRNELENSGGFAYLAEIAKNTPSSANIVAYAGYVSSYRQKRLLLGLAQDLIAQVSDIKNDTTDLLEHAEQRLFNLREPQNSGQIADIPSSLEAYLNSLEKRCTYDNHITGTPTGFSELNDLTSGFQSSDLILLAGRPAMGKTAFGLALCEAALTHLTKPVQVYSLEMPTEQLLARFIAMLGQLPLQHLRNGNMNDEDWARVSSAMSILLENWKQRLLIDDSSYMTPSLLRSRVRKNIRKYGQPSLILLDYLQLMQCPGQENRTQEIAEISRSLKGLAKEIGCPVVALSQLNRSLENRADKRPNNGDLRDSGSLEQDADLILFVYRDEVYNPNSPDAGIAEIILGKQRNGPIGTIKVKYLAEMTRFEDFNGGRYDF